MEQRKNAISLASGLVADDHAETQFGLVGLLKDKLGAQSTHAVASFGDALEILKAQAIDLAILDLGLPGLANPAGLSQIRTAWPATKLVVLSGSDAPADILTALAAGVHGYVLKTETLDGLAGKISHVLAGEIYVPPCLADRTRPRRSGAIAPSDLPAGSPKLTTRQRDVLQAIVQGRSNKQIAKDLGLAIGTVKMHVSAVLTVLGAQNRLHAATIGRHLFE